MAGENTVAPGDIPIQTTFHPDSTAPGPAAGLRLHTGDLKVSDGAYGGDLAGSGRLDGRRHAIGGAI